MRRRWRTGRTGLAPLDDDNDTPRADEDEAEPTTTITGSLFVVIVVVVMVVFIAVELLELLEFVDERFSEFDWDEPADDDDIEMESFIMAIIV